MRFLTVFLIISQVPITGADNRAQYWPNLGNQLSVIVIGAVSPFASVKCWADNGGLYRQFKFTDLQPKLGPVSALYQADCHFVIFTVENHSASEKIRVWHNIGPLLCRKQVLAARVRARIGCQVHTGVIISTMARYWQPIFGKIFPMPGQCWAVSNFALGLL